MELLELVLSATFWGMLTGSTLFLFVEMIDLITKKIKLSKSKSKLEDLQKKLEDLEEKLQNLEHAESAHQEFTIKNCGGDFDYLVEERLTRLEKLVSYLMAKDFKDERFK